MPRRRTVTAIKVFVDLEARLLGIAQTGGSR